MQRKEKLLIAFSVLSVISLLSYGNTEKVYALTSRSAEPDGTMSIADGCAYNAVQDYIFLCSIEGGVVHIHVINGATLALVTELTTTLTAYEEQNDHRTNSCSATLCFFYGRVGTNPAVLRVSMSGFSQVNYNENAYSGCIITGMEFFGTSIYATMADLGGCPYTGMYQLSIGFTTDSGNPQWVEYDSVTAIGDTNHIQGTCIVNSGAFFITSTSTLIRKYDLSTKSVTSSSSLGSGIAKIACDSTHVYASVDGAIDLIKRVSISSLTIEADTRSLTNPRSIKAIGDSVYVGRNDAVTITVLDKNNLSSGFTFFSTAHNNVDFFKGNSTRFNSVAPSTNDNIVYAFDGIIGDDFEDDTPSGGGSAGGVCLNIDANGDGRVNVLDCVGEATAFSGFTGGQNVTDTMASISDGLGLTNCGDNPDHETCGSGLFLFLILLLISEALALAGYLGFVRLTNAEAHLMDIGLMILIIAFTDLAIGFYLNWIPDIVFYAIVVMVTGLLTFGLIRHIRGG